ncbi:uncharacterized protein LOC105395100 [Plutella xylostella]|uniref:uncharacterized protein LOC105395100 n=1 Tax=Plutella xylostella TaxID=51655 RepID=UPI002032F85D|nr:uncharacterized protein LOC105395100 [Plutella xylostella]
MSAERERRPSPASESRRSGRSPPLDSQERLPSLESSLDLESIPRTLPRSVRHGNELRKHKTKQPVKRKRPKMARARRKLPDHMREGLEGGRYRLGKSCTSFAALDRLEHISRPKRRHILNTWRDHTADLSPETIDRFREMLDADEPFSPAHAYNYFMAMRNAERMKRKALRKLRCTCCCTKTSSALSRGASLKIARAVQRKLAYPLQLQLTGAEQRLSMLVFREVCRTLRWKPRPRCRSPQRCREQCRRKFAMEVADQVTLWIGEVLTACEDRMIMSDGTEEDDILRPILGDWPDDGRGDSEGPCWCHFDFEGDEWDAFKLLLTAMECDGRDEELVSQGWFTLTYKQAAVILAQTPIELGTFEEAVRAHIEAGLRRVAARSTTDELRDSMNDVIELCSKLLAQYMEDNKHRGAAFNLLVQLMKAQHPELELYEKDYVKKTYVEAGDDLDSAKSLRAEEIHQKLATEIYNKLKTLVHCVTPSEMKDEMAEALEGATRYLARVGDEPPCWCHVPLSGEELAAFKILIMAMKRRGAEPLAARAAYTLTYEDAAEEMLLTPSLDATLFDEEVKDMIEGKLHTTVETVTPEVLQNAMNSVVDKAAKFLAEHMDSKKHRTEAFLRLIQAMKAQDPEKVLFQKNGVNKTYVSSGEELDQAKRLSVSQFDAETAEGVHKNLTELMIDTPDHMKQDMAEAIDAASKYLTRTDEEDMEAFRILIAAMKKRGSEQLATRGHYTLAYGEGAKELEEAPSLQASRFYKDVKEGIEDKLNAAVKPTTPAALQTNMDQTVEKSSKYLAQHMEENKHKGPAFKKLVETMKAQAPERVLFQKEQADTTYVEGGQDLESARRLSVAVALPELQQHVQRELEVLMKDLTPKDMAEEMAVAVQAGSRYLARVDEEGAGGGTDVFKILVAAMTKRGYDELATRGKYSMTYQDAADILVDASPNLKSTSKFDEDVKKLIQNKLHETVKPTTPAALQADMNELVDISSKYLAQHAEDNKHRSKAFEKLVQTLKAQDPAHVLFQKDNVQKTYVRAGHELGSARSLSVDDVHKDLEAELHKKLTTLVNEVTPIPEDMKTDMEEAVTVSSKYLARVGGTDDNEKGIDKLLDEAAQRALEEERLKNIDGLILTEEEKKRLADEARKKLEDEQKNKEEEERKRKELEEEERKRKELEEEERKRKELEDKKKREEEDELRRQKEEDERRRLEEEARRAKEDEERRRLEEQLRMAKDDEERKRLEEELKNKKDAEEKRRLEELQRQKDEEERKRLENEMKKSKDNDDEKRKGGKKLTCKEHKIEMERKKKLEKEKQKDEEEKKKAISSSIKKESQDNRPPEKVDPNKLKALEILLREMEGKGREPLLEQEPQSAPLTYTEAVDWLKNNPWPAEIKAVKDSRDTARVNDKIRRRLCQLVISLTLEPPVEEAMPGALAESSKALSEHVVSRSYKKAAEELLLREMQRRGAATIATVDCNKESYEKAVIRLKLSKSRDEDSPAEEVSGHIAWQLHEATRRRVTQKLADTMKETIQKTSDYLSTRVGKPDKEADGFIILIREMENTGDELLVDSEFYKQTYNKAAAYLKSLPSFECETRDDAANENGIKDKLRKLVDKVEVSDSVIDNATQLLASNAFHQGQYNEILREIVKRIELTGDEIIIRHGDLARTFRDGANILQGKGFEDLKEKNAEPIPFKKIEISLTRMMETSDPLPFNETEMRTQIDEVMRAVTLYLAVHLTKKTIHICRCMKNATVQCELWCDALVNAALRPCCACAARSATALGHHLQDTDNKQIALITCPGPKDGKTTQAGQTSSEDDKKLCLETKKAVCQQCNNPACGKDHSYPCQGMPATSSSLMGKNKTDEDTCSCDDGEFKCPAKDPASSVEPCDCATGPSSSGGVKRSKSSKESSKTSHHDQSSKKRSGDRDSTAYFMHAITTNPYVQNGPTKLLNRTAPSLSLASHSVSRVTESSSIQSAESSLVIAQQNNLSKATTSINKLSTSLSLPFKTEYHARAPIVWTGQATDWHAAVVSLVWNVQAWRGWLRGHIERGLRGGTDNDDGDESDDDRWEVYSRRTKSDILQWRHYNVFSQQLSLHLELRYRDKEIISPSNSSIKTEDYISWHHEMLSIISTFNRWTHWLSVVLDETDSLEKTADTETDNSKMRWEYFSKKIRKSSPNWNKYNNYLQESYMEKHKTLMLSWLPPWSQSAPVWVIGAGGGVPCGAVAAGLSAAEATWVARATHGAQVLPGALHPSKHCVLVYADGAVHTYSRYQVLCNAEVSWLSWRAGDIGAQAVLVAPGVHIGRVTYQDSHLIGAVTAPDYRCNVVIYGRPFAFTCYELLVLIPSGQARD